MAKKKPKKKTRLRNAEYYDLQNTLDKLYAESKNNCCFRHLMQYVASEDNIKLAYRNIKKNTGSKTAGADGKTIEDLNKWSISNLISHIQKRLKWYQPNKIRRVEIPKDNGKTRPLGIPTIMDRLIQQCFLQILEPICEAKFFERSNGFRPNRSAENAISQVYKMIQTQHLYYVVDVDIKSFFDNVSHGELLKQIRALRMERNAAEQRVKELEAERQSPYKAFFYSSPEKQAWVMKRLEEMDIPYRETDNGFEAQECYINAIRKIEQEYKAPRTILRDKLRDDIDRCLLQSGTIDELLVHLEELGYTVKHGKYLSVKPENGNAYIRLKSLGEYYTERALRNRIKANVQYEREIAKMLEEAKRTEAPTYTVIYTMRVYIAAFKQSRLPIRKRDQRKPVTWTNDAELDRLLALNKRIAEGATLESLQKEFAEKEKRAAEKTDALLQIKEGLKCYYDMREKLEVLFEGKQSDIYFAEQAKSVLKEFPSVTDNNWKNVYKLIEDEENAMRKADAESEQAQKELREAADLVAAMERIANGSYVQSLIADENDRRNSDFIPNGTIYGSGAIV